jgi:molybdate transport system permease protein
MDQQALVLSLHLAAFTTAILLVVAIPAGYWLAFSRTRWSAVVEAAVALPLVLPPTVLGFYLLVFLEPHTSAGKLLTRIIGHPLAFSFAGLLIGSLVFSLPFAVQPITAGFRAVDRDVLEAAQLLTSSQGRILLRVLLPLIRPSLLAAAVLAFTHTMGEFGVVLMIGGGIPGMTRTLSISIYDQVQDFAYGEANHTALLLLGLSFLALLIVYGRRARA